MQPGRVDCDRISQNGKVFVLTPFLVNARACLHKQGLNRSAWFAKRIFPKQPQDRDGARTQDASTCSFTAAQMVNRRPTSCALSYDSNVCLGLFAIGVVRLRRRLLQNAERTNVNRRI